MRKTISERCELVKLCDVNCSGPVFLRHTVELINQCISVEGNDSYSTNGLRPM